MIKPVQEELPIYLGAIGPKAIEQTGEIANGWLPAFFNPYDSDRLMEHLRPGAREGRARSARTSTSRRWSPSPSRTTSRPRARPCGRSSPSTSAAWAPRARTSTWTSATTTATATRRACQDRFLSGDRHGAAAALTPALIDTVTIAATPSTLEKRLGAFADAGVDTLVATPFGDRPGVLDALAGALA